MINNFSCSENKYNSSEGTDNFKKGSRFPITAFLLLIVTFLATACESPGPVGNDIVSKEDDVKSESFTLENYTVVEENAYSGRLARTAMGYFEDPIYGTIKSVPLLKPSINSSVVDTIYLEDTVSLQLIFSEEVYGDSLATSNYEIYEVGQIWRGTELRYNTEIPVDMSSKIGEFQLSAGEDSVIVDLSSTWTSKFAGFFNADTTMSSAERDSIYIHDFPGVAIVPSESNQNIRFLKSIDMDDTDDSESVTSFIVNAGEEGEDEDPGLIGVRDWGVSFLRTNEPDYANGIVLHNTERVLKLEIDWPAEEFASKNIVNAQLVFSKDDSALKNYPEITRPNTNVILAHVFEDEPEDVMAEIFTKGETFGASLDDTSNAFLMDISQYILDEAYGDPEERFMYISVESMNGIYYSSLFFDPNSTDIKKPRLVITYVEE